MKLGAQFVNCKNVGCAIFKGDHNILRSPQYTQITTMNMYFLIEIRHGIYVQCHRNNRIMPVKPRLGRPENIFPLASSFLKFAEKKGGGGGGDVRIFGICAVYWRNMVYLVVNIQ